MVCSRSIIVSLGRFTVTSWAGNGNRTTADAPVELILVFLPRSLGHTRSAQVSASRLEISSVERRYAQRGCSHVLLKWDQSAQIIFPAPFLIGVFIANAPSAKSQYPKASGQSAEAVRT
jgi:hypothetical protein